MLLPLYGCENLFLGEDEPNDPVNNFEIFWHDFDQHYGLFLARGWNWDSIYNVYRPQVTAQTTDLELFHVFRNMILYLDESHTFIYNPAQRWFFRSGSEENRIVMPQFSIELVKNKYIENYHPIPNAGPDDGGTYIYGKVKNKDIGYIYLYGLKAPDENFLDFVIDKIGGQKAIILDLRNNYGGFLFMAEAIAGRFADGEHFIYTIQERNGLNHADFTDKKKVYTLTKGREHFSKPLIVLTDKMTVSAAEHLLLYLKSFSQVTQIGDTTQGDFSHVSMRRFLPNGVQYQYSIMMCLLPDGRSLDGIGHAPDIQIRNSLADILAGNDLVFEKALVYLFDKYGIE